MASDLCNRCSESGSRRRLPNKVSRKLSRCCRGRWDNSITLLLVVLLLNVSSDDGDVVVILSHPVPGEENTY